MSADADFRAELSNYAPLVALVGTNIAMNAVSQGAGLPSVVFTSQSEREYTLDNTLAAERILFDVQCWAQTGVSAQEVADTVEAAVSGTQYLVTARSCGYDEQTDLHAEVLTIEFLV